MTGRCAGAWLALLLALGGCSVLSQPEGPVYCSLQAERDGEQPCGEGRRCVATPATGGDVGECRDVLCAPEDVTERGNGLPEQCNGIDDDCDGLVDEGNDWNADGQIQPEESFDRDRDGFTTCGTLPRTEGDEGRPGVSPDLVDCNDLDANVHPSAPGRPAPPEVCDGKDNDCDGLADLVSTPDGDSKPPCPDGYICDARRAACVFDCASCPEGHRCEVDAEPARCAPGRCDTGEVSCPAGTYCNREYGACLRRKPLGERCAVDAECETGVCFPLSTLDLPGEGGICGKACCNDGDCPAEAACWAPYNGVRSCVPREQLPGRKRPGERCDSSSECTSLACVSDGGQCVSGCVHAEGDCGPGESCAVAVGRREGSALLRTVCLPGERGDSEPIPCVSTSECPETSCTVGIWVVPCPKLCRAASVEDGEGFVTVCQTDEGFAREWSGRCVGSLGTDCPRLKPDGASCTTRTDCLDALCEGGRCIGRCCRDSDCGPGRVCRPRPGPISPYEMRCSDAPGS